MHPDKRVSKKERRILNYKIYLIGGLIALIAISFVISFYLYSNKIVKNDDYDRTTEKLIGMENKQSNEENITKQATAGIGNKITENIIANNDKDTTNVVKEDIQSNSTKIVEIKKKEENNESNTEDIVNLDNSNSNENSEEVKLDFSLPVEGEIIKNYAKENLLYSETLKEWTTHLGIDIKADKTSVVKATERGKVVSIKNDPRYGLVIIIEHENGFKSVYANLLSSEFVVVGEEVEKGQTIGTIGNSAIFEIKDPSHLHFELLKDNINVDPMQYIQN